MTSESDTAGGETSDRKLTLVTHLRKSREKTSKEGENKEKGEGDAEEGKEGDIELKRREKKEKTER